MSKVAPLDELRILDRYAGSTNVSALYERMEELGEQLGYGREYWHALEGDEDFTDDWRTDRRSDPTPDPRYDGITGTEDKARSRERKTI